MKSKEDYLPGYTPNASSFMANRTAQSHAAFVLPKLRPGMRLLDCGCGPGSITLGLAQLVSPAEVIGVDQESSQLEIARASAAKLGLTTVRFESSSVYDLPFADGSFDTVFAHAVFEHLREPMAALSEIRRVLVPGGLVALRSPDWGGFLLAPETEELAAAIAYYQSLQIQSGGDVHVGRKFKALLREAGFGDLEFSASYECYRSLEVIGEYLAQRIELSGNQDSSSIDRLQTQKFAATLRDWHRSEDGVFAQSWCEILGTKSIAAR
jgi:ubiquinone/menaquinone biosynthesis C-methylase UbiE